MKYLLSWILLIIISLMWFMLYQAGDLPYDDNYRALLSALIFSFVVCIDLLFLFFKKNKSLRTNIIMILVFLISSSPISLFYVALYYEAIFGKVLAV